MDIIALEKTAEKALVFLHQKAEEHGIARAQADYMDSWVKSELARIKASYTGLSDAAATTEAMRSKEYLDALQARKEAAEAHYTNAYKREAAMAHIEAWRTACSNARANV